MILSDWLALRLLKGVSATDLCNLAQLGWSVEDLLNALDTPASQLQLDVDSRDQLQCFVSASGELYQRVKAIEQTAAQLQMGCLLLGDENYPALLKSIANPPSAIFYRGNPQLLTLPQVAIVGSRRCSQAGLRAAHHFAQQLSQGGYAITSGLALGIDGAAHQGALEASGATIAVLGNGLDQVYPKRHQQLFEQLLQFGCLVSEFLPGTPPRAAHFPSRNRIISGFSCAVLVVQAQLRSGSLITARLAAEQGREVFALPGSVDNPYHHGCHRLIRQGASLVENAQQLAEQLSVMTGVLSEQLVLEVGVSNEHPSTLLRLLDDGPASVEQLQQRLDLDTGQILAELAELELSGAIERREGRYWRC